MLVILSLLGTFTVVLCRPQFPQLGNAINLHPSGAGIPAQLQNAASTFHHDDSRQVAGERKGSLNGNSSQGSKSSAFKGKEGQFTKAIASNANLLSAKSKGGSHKKGQRWGQAESFGEAWDDKEKWDESVNAAKVKETKVSEGKGSEVAASDAQQGSNDNLTVNEDEKGKGFIIWREKKFFWRCF